MLLESISGAQPRETVIPYDSSTTFSSEKSEVVSGRAGQRRLRTETTSISSASQPPSQLMIEQDQAVEKIRFEDAILIFNAIEQLPDSSLRSPRFESFYELMIELYEEIKACLYAMLYQLLEALSRQRAVLEKFALSLSSIDEYIRSQNRLKDRLAGNQLESISLNIAIKRMENYSPTNCSYSAFVSNDSISFG